MVIGSHVIFGAYGFWLPNDPRGSWSEFVGSWELFRYGPATKTTETRSVAHRPHDRAKRLATKEALAHPAVQFDGAQTEAVAAGFAKYAAEAGLLVWACAVMPDHVHLVVGRHRLDVEKLVMQLKGRATTKLTEAGVHPFEPEDGKRPKCFARGEWKVFLETAEDIHRAVAYVENNPVKEGRPVQRWPFVTPFAEFV